MTPVAGAPYRELSGTVLDLGAGSAARLDRLPPGTTWLGMEPSARRRRALAASAGGRSRVIAGVAERIPLADDSVDGVLSNIALCSVSDQRATLAEVIRVLRPGGVLVFHEHVAAPDGGWRYRGQRLAAPLSRRFDAGCDPSRRTWLAIQDAGFRRVDLRWSRRATFPLGTDFVSGAAWV